MTATLQDVIVVMREDASDQLEVQLDQVTLLERLNIKFDKFLTDMELMQMSLLEAAREKAGPVAPAGGGDTTPSKPEGATGALGIVAAVTASLAGLAIGFVEGIASSIKATLKLLKVDKIFKPISDIISKAFGKGSKTAGVLDDIVTKAYVFIDDFIIKPMKTFGTKVKAFFKPVADLFTRFGKFVDPGGDVGKFAKTVGKLFDPIADGAKAVGQIFVRFGKTFSSFFKAARALGAVVGRLFIPIGIIMGIVDTVTGAIDGFTNQEGDMVDKIIGGLFGALKGLVNGLLMIPLDLLKSGISWIAEKLGFEQFSEMLDSFSFEETFSTMVDSVKDMVLGIKDWFVENLSPSAITKKLGNLSDSITQFIKELVRSILPDPTAPALSIEGIAARAIPAAVYEFAGINPETGEAIPEPEKPAEVSQEQAQGAPEGAPTIGYTSDGTPFELTEGQRRMAEEDHAKLDAMMAPSPEVTVSAPPTPEVSVSVPAAPASEPEIQKLPEFVTVDAVSGRFMAFSPSRQERALFDTVEEAKAFVESKSEKQIALEKEMQKNFEEMMAEGDAQTSSPRVEQSNQLENVSNQNSEMKSEQNSASANVVNAPSTSNVSNVSNNTQVMSVPMPPSKNFDDNYAGIVGR
jgi:hypothetical protein